MAPVPPFPTGNVPVTWVVSETLDKVPPSVSDPDDVTVPVNVMPLTDPVPETLVTVPTYWSFDVIVKFGYDPVTTVVPAPVSETIWFGAVFVIVNDGYVPLIEIPVPAVRVTV